MKINKNLRNLLLAGVLLGLIVGSWAVWYVFYKPHRDISAEKPAYVLTSDALTNSFRDDTTAYKKYADQALLVEGTVTAIEGSHVSMGNIICNIDSTDIGKLSTLKNGDVVKIQGRFSTYNDLMEEIMLDKCVLK
jgi:tRNA_anti-like